MTDALRILCRIGPRALAYELATLVCVLVICAVVFLALVAVAD